MDLREHIDPLMELRLGLTLEAHGATWRCVSGKWLEVTIAGETQQVLRAHRPLLMAIAVAREVAGLPALEGAV